MPNSRPPKHLRRVTGGPVPWPAIDAAKALPWAEASTGLTLADSQAAAVRLALRSKATVITGGPGVGKTTIVKTIPADTADQGCDTPAVRSHGPGRQAHVGGHRHGGQDHPPAAGGRSEDLRFSAAGRATRSIATSSWWTKVRWSMSC